MAKRKIQKDKQRSIKHTHKTKDRVARIILITPMVSLSSSYYSQLYEYLPTMSRDGPVAL
jgi:hypothetical protein